MEFSKISGVQSIRPENNLGETYSRLNFKQENDKVEINSPKSKKKKIAIGVAAVSLAATAAELVYLIGRNPAKAAKVLKGNAEILEPAYKEAKELTDKIINKEGQFQTKFEDIFKLFKEPGEKSQLNISMNRFETFVSNQKEQPPQEVMEAFNTLKKNLEDFHKKIEENLIKGEKIDYEAAEKFKNANKKYSDIIQEYIKNIKIDDINTRLDLDDLYYKFSGTSISFDAMPKRVITECPKEILPSDNVFFHGTMKPKGIYEHGFTPYASRQINQSSRELGAGVYLSPDVKVSAYFTGLIGPIIPVRLAKDAKTALITEDTYKKLATELNSFISERINQGEYQTLPDITKNAITECLFQEVFKKAGYDAVYTPKGVKSGGLMQMIFSPDINEVLGRNQSQIVVFSPEKLEIVDRTLKERICDLKDKFSAIIAQLKYQRTHMI